MTVINRFPTPVLIALATIAFAVGCYNPKIKPGGLKCNDEFIQGCPTGYHCDGAGVCQPGPGTDGAVVERPADAKDTGIDQPGSEPSKMETTPPVDMGACFTAVAGCTPDMAGKLCDPLCQTGCGGCREKCSVNMGGAPTCNAPSGTRVAKHGQSCDFFREGTPQQSDNCEPGLLCVHDACGELCAKFCRTDADCPNSLCTRTLPGGAKHCDVATVECNPVKSAGPYNCPGATQACYLSSTVKDRTFCDCPLNGQLEGASCAASRDCFGGLVCVDPSGGPDLRCRRACTPPNSTGGCLTGMCRAMLGSTKFGFCL